MRTEAANITVQRYKRPTKPLILKPDRKLTEQVLHILPRQCLHKGSIIRNDVFSQCSFLFLQLQYFIFDSVFTDHAVSKDIIGLPDTVGTVNRAFCSTAGFRQGSTIFT